MLVRNLAARLITLDWKGKKYPLMPAGNAVPVPNDAKDSKFLQALEKDRSVEINESSSQGNLLEGTDDRDPLRDRLVELGGKLNKTWGVARLNDEIKKLEDANAGAGGEDAGGEGDETGEGAGEGAGTEDQE